jgi:hypothetical protein
MAGVAPAGAAAGPRTGSLRPHRRRARPRTFCRLHASFSSFNTRWERASESLVVTVCGAVKMADKGGLDEGPPSVRGLLLLLLLLR